MRFGVLSPEIILNEFASIEKKIQNQVMEPYTHDCCVTSSKRHRL